MVDIYRTLSKGQYDTDFSSVVAGATFPSAEVRGRNAVYRYYNRLFTGEYAKNKKLQAMVDSQAVDIPYTIIAVNLFKKTVEKMYSLIFGNETVIKAGDIENDLIVNKLVERTEFISKLGQSATLRSIYGDVVIKIHKNGLSVVSPLSCFKIVDKHDKDKVIASVLYEYLYSNINGCESIEHIRFEIHCAGWIYEAVHKYMGNNISGTIGEKVEYEYRGRKVKSTGNYYKTGVDISLIQWMSLNKMADGVYGQSPLVDIKDLVFALEARLSSDKWVLDGNSNPSLIVGMSSITTNEKTGVYEFNALHGKYIVQNGSEDVTPKYLEWTGNLDNGRGFREDILSLFYEMSEMTKSFFTGEYSGNISEETFNNTIKSALDRASREVDENWYIERNCLYALCRLNGIDVCIEDISINHNIGRIDDESKTADLVVSLIKNEVFSKKSMLEKYYGLNAEQAEEEAKRIKLEKGEMTDDFNGVA